MKKFWLTSILLGAIMFAACLFVFVMPKENHADRDIRGKIKLAARDDPWKGLVDAFNNNFETLRVLTCAEPIPHKFEVGDILTKENLSDNFGVIIKALERGGCKK